MTMLMQCNAESMKCFIFRLHQMQEIFLQMFVVSVCLSLGLNWQSVQCTLHAVFVGSFDAAFTKCLWPLVVLRAVFNYFYLYMDKATFLLVDGVYFGSRLLWQKTMVSLTHSALNCTDHPCSQFVVVSVMSGYLLLVSLFTIICFFVMKSVLTTFAFGTAVSNRC